jgi:hypothetical protein
MFRIRMRASAALVGLILTALIATTGAVRLGAQKKEDKKPQEGAITAAQRQELAPVVTLVDEVMKGTVPAGSYMVPPTAAGKDVKDAPAPAAPASTGPQPASPDVPLSWKNDFLKAQNNLIYVPFTISVEPGKLGGPSVVAYLRVAARGTTAPPAAAEKPADKKDDKKKDSKKEETKKEESLYPFEDVYFTDLRGAANQPLKLTRAFAVPAGDYDVYVALRERAVAGSSDPIKVAVLKQELTVPNYHSDELQTSSIIVADKIEQLTAPLTGDALKERPYVLGDAEITPAPDLKFRKTEEINVVFQVYGAKYGDDKKPDVTIEYAFMQKDANGEKPFNKTPPQAMNAQTLPANFDPSQGHQLVGGQAIPLTTFPEGDFRLEIKITDNKANKSITRDVLFSVVPAS